MTWKVHEPSAARQVRKCPTRAAVDHRSHGELVNTSGWAVEVPVHHPKWADRRLKVEGAFAL